VFRWKRPTLEALRVETRPRATDEGTGPDARWLIATDDGTVYDPLAEEPCLFRLFADLAPGPEFDAPWPWATAFEGAVVAFAARWGRLGCSDLSVVDSEHAQRLVPAEPLSTWYEEAGAMRAAVDLFDAVQKKNYDALRQWITARDDRRPAVYCYRREDVRGAIGGSVLRVDRSADRLRGLMAAARYLLWAEFINMRLRAHVSVLGVLDHGRTQLRAVPNNLLGALWLTLARAADGNSRYRRCGYRPCQKWIEITGTFQGSTKARRFCCDNHRVYSHNQKPGGARKGRWG
jgi:hypothetical protein